MFRVRRIIAAIGTQKLVLTRNHCVFRVQRIIAAVGTEKLVLTRNHCVFRVQRIIAAVRTEKLVLTRNHCVFRVQRIISAVGCQKLILTRNNGLFRFNVLSRLPAVRVRISHPHRVRHTPSPPSPPPSPALHPPQRLQDFRGCVTHYKIRSVDFYPASECLAVKVSLTPRLSTPEETDYYLLCRAFTAASQNTGRVSTLLLFRNNIHAVHFYPVSKYPAVKCSPVPRFHKSKRPIL